MRDALDPSRIEIDPDPVYPPGEKVVSGFAFGLGLYSLFVLMFEPETLAATATGERLPGPFDEIWCLLSFAGGAVALASALRRAPLGELTGLMLCAAGAATYAITLAVARGLTGGFAIWFAGLGVIIYTWRSRHLLRYAVEVASRG